MENNNQWQARPYWLMMSLSIIVIVFWIITICAPSVFWKFMDIILWFFLFTTGVSAIINSLKNKNSQFVWLLWIWGFLLCLLGLMLIFSFSQLVWTLMIWMFAIWALIRWVMLIIFGVNSRNQQPLRWWIIWLGILLFVLSIIIAVSDKWDARTLAWVCIWISTIIDGISLLAVTMKLKDNPSLQSELINKANENEIAQWWVIINETVVVTTQNLDQLDNTENQNQ